MRTTFLSSQPYSKRIFPLLTAQFLGVFNDNAFKMLAILAVVGPHSDYFLDAAFLFAMTISYVLPFILLTAPAGSLCDRMQKRYIIILSKMVEFLVMILGAFCLGNAQQWGVLPLLGVMFLMTAQTAFFSPAYQGILPETFSAREISRANGDNGMISFIAAIAGIGLSPIVFTIAGKLSNFLVQKGIATLNPLYLAGLLLVILSFFSITAAFRILPTGEYERRYLTRMERIHSAWMSLRIGWKALTARRAIFLSALGDAFFLGLGVAIQTVLVIFAKYGLPENGGYIELAALQLIPAVGMGLGCFLCGKQSQERIELGFVPYGALGIAIFLPLAAYLPGSAVSFGGVILHPLSLLWLCLAGIAGGFFVIPLRAYMQQNLKPSSRGAALACSNALCFIAVLISSLLVFVLMTGAGDLPAGVPDFVKQTARYAPHFTPHQLFLIIGLVTLLVTVFSICLLPYLLLRAAVVALTHTLYKIRLNGAENLPDSGPALLVSNHVSFVDGLLITACTSRKVRFLMHEDYYKHPLIHPIARITGFIEVPASSRIKSMQAMFEIVKETLRHGDIVCVFPEGKITRNGLMDDFKGGFSKMIPEEMEVPIIPVSLGLVWGSLFSYFYGKLKFHFPQQFPYPATVSFGNPILKKDVTAFDLRQAVSELGADTEMQPREKENPIHYQLAKNATRHPFRKIIADSDGKMLNQFKVLLASILISRELRRILPENAQYVGVMLPNTTASTLSILGVLMADRVPAPLNFTVSEETLRFSLNKAGITHVVTSRLFLSKINRKPIPEMVFLEDLVREITGWKKFCWTLLTLVLPHQELMNLVAPVTHRNVFGTAVLLFSSGSTGNPKGIMLSHHNINADCNSFLRVVNWTPKERLLGNLPLFHAFGFTTGFWTSIMMQNLVVYVKSPLESAHIGATIEKYKLTTILATPTFMQAYMKRCKPEQFSSVRLAIVGAEKLRKDISDKFNEFMGGKISLIEGYGCTETSPIVTINVGSSILSIGKVIGRAGSIGAPMPGTCVKIVDPVTGVTLPPDTDGLMLVKGPIVMQGYLKDPVQTAHAINPEGWYDTGDIARMDIDGYVMISGRLSRFSKIAGEMVPHEMLECVMNELAGCENRTLAVTGIPDPDKGEALVVLYTNELKITPEEMNTRLRERSIPNLWIPRTKNYWLIDQIPILGTGKMDMMSLNNLVKKLLKEKNLQK